MSLQTTLARAEANHWDKEWRDHKRHCAGGAGAARKWDHLCPAGTNVREERRASAAELARNRLLDKISPPGQGVLL